MANAPTQMPNEPPAAGQKDAMDMHEIASHLLELLPEADRAAALPLFVQVILPAELRGLETHPNPERYTELVWTALADELRLSEPRARKDTVRMQRARAQLRQSSAIALHLGVARYILAHPEAEATAGHWLSPAAKVWIARGQDQVVLEAVEQLNHLERWGEQTQVTHSQLYAAHQSTWHHARLTLQSAVSGSFETTGGSMADFLRSVGGQSQSIRLGG